MHAIVEHANVIIETINNWNLSKIENYYNTFRSRYTAGALILEELDAEEKCITKK
jgi:hypothetical protein